jgi:hypothetical protein
MPFIQNHPPSNYLQLVYVINFRIEAEEILAVSLYLKRYLLLAYFLKLGIGNHAYHEVYKIMKQLT